MGSYATLQFGHFSVGEFKNKVALEPFLLFAREDHRQTKRTGEDEDEYVDDTFVTTAAVARRRIDARGLTMATCRSLFDEFRIKETWSYDDDDPRSDELRISLDEYLDACRRVFSTLTSWHEELATTEDDKQQCRIVCGTLFSEDAEIDFSDASYCVLLRSFLEVIPDDCQIVYDISDLVHGGYVDLTGVSDVYEHFVGILVRRLGLDYQLYGFFVEDDPNLQRRLRQIIEGFTEDQFITLVLVPLLERMGYQRVRKVESHGRNEFGSDILPFRFTTPLGTVEYYALQAKAVAIHGTSSQSGKCGEVIYQADQAFSVGFIDAVDSERKKIDKFIIATSQSITPDARRVIEERFEKDRRVVLLDIAQIVTLVKQHRLAQYLLFTPFE